MNTELDGPLSVWGGRTMAILGIFGVFLPVLFYTTGINIFEGYLREDGVLGLGAIIASTFGGIGGAMVIKTHAYKIEIKERKNSNCNSLKTTGKHKKEILLNESRESNSDLLIPERCSECGFKQLVRYTRYGVIST